MRRGRTGCRPNGGGFSLIEVLVALVVIVFGLWGILDLVTSNETNDRIVQRRAAAIELAGAKLAEIQAAGFDALLPHLPKPGGEAATHSLYPAAGPTKFDLPYDTGTFSWQARFDPTGQPGVVNVEVRVFLEDFPADTPAEKLQRNSVSVGALLIKK